MNSSDKKVSFALIFEKEKTPAILCEVRNHADKFDTYGKGYVSFTCKLTEFKEFLKELPMVCKNTETEIKLYGRVSTDTNNCTFFNYLIDQYGIKEGDAQVISKNQENNIPFRNTKSTHEVDGKEGQLCY